jgi:hypothetical protein
MGHNTTHRANRGPNTQPCVFLFSCASGAGGLLWSGGGDTAIMAIAPVGSQLEIAKPPATALVRLYLGTRVHRMRAPRRLGRVRRERYSSRPPPRTQPRREHHHKRGLLVDVAPLLARRHQPLPAAVWAEYHPPPPISYTPPSSSQPPLFSLLSRHNTRHTTRHTTICRAGRC